MATQHNCLTKLLKRIKNGNTKEDRLKRQQHMFLEDIFFTKISFYSQCFSFFFE